MKRALQYVVSGVVLLTGFAGRSAAELPCVGLPCMSISSHSEVWSCPGGGQGYFSVISDGCHLYVKLEGCSGGYHDWYFRYFAPTPPRTGDATVDAAFNAASADLMSLQKRATLSDRDVAVYVQGTVRKMNAMLGLTKNQGLSATPTRAADITAFKKKTAAVRMP